MTNTQKTIRLSDYRPFDYKIDQTQLFFTLDQRKTLVRAIMAMRPNTDTNPDGKASLVLNGEALTLQSVRMNQRELTSDAYEHNATTLTIHQIELDASGGFVLETEVAIDPAANTTLMGLYVSNDMFCTQCEAQGFRRITYYPDRPDVMSRFEVVIEADAAAYPVLLSNGNQVEQGTLPEGRHFVRWEDPFPKPSYLFALVAGDLKCLVDMFKTRSGKDVILRIFVEEKDLDKVDHAMTSLKQAFVWDEKVYGREYDLEVFNIVAVSHFNMGAMENKSLNIFNTSAVLANPATATDASHDRVRDIIAHEYFHNWSGNRVTCRDWHQLSLKEGFTVFRDASFTADHGSPVVKRIDDVTHLKTNQFKEDAGPTAHAVLPKEVKAFDNFYTLTIYNKGAEIIGMYKTLLGDAAYYEGVNIYFDRHDGEAVTIEAFARAMSDAGKKDLDQFCLWYHQAGTPHVTLAGDYDAGKQTFALTVRQNCRPTPETPLKKPFVIPLRMGLLDANGKDMTLSCGREGVLEITREEETFIFENVCEKPTPSLFRHFSAPVTYDYPYTKADLLFLMKYDADGFNRWDACQQLSEKMLLGMITETVGIDEDLIEVFGHLLSDATLDQMMVARMLMLPSETYLSQRVALIDPDAIHQAVQSARKAIARGLENQFASVYERLNIQAPYDLKLASKARRALKNCCLTYLCKLETPAYLDLARKQFDSADNMTDKLAAFIALAHSEESAIRQQAIMDFYTAYKENQLVVDMWFSVQAASPVSDTLDVVKSLLTHEAFDPKSPNDIRSTVGVFSSNAIHFHRQDGAGYRFVADYIIKLHQVNPQIAARLTPPFALWRKYDQDRRRLMQKELERILAVKDLSVNVYEQVSLCLSDAHQ